MPQIFRLVEHGRVDKMIAFDRLPDFLVRNVKKRDLAGLPRYWEQFTEKDEKGKPFTYALDYKLINADREKWENISSYVRRAVDLKTRLLDKIEDMALAMAQSPQAPLELEPENIPVIKISEGIEQEKPEIITEQEVIEQAQAAELPKKRGRPKKVLAEA